MRSSVPDEGTSKRDRVPKAASILERQQKQVRTNFIECTNIKVTGAALETKLGQVNHRVYKYMYM